MDQYYHRTQLKNDKGSENAFRMLLVLLWTRNTIFSFVTVILRGIPILGLLSDYALTVCIIVCAVIALPWITKHIRISDIFFYIMCAIVVIVSMLIYKDNTPYIRQDLWKMLGTVFPFYFVGLCFSYDLCKKDLFWASAAGVCAGIAYQLFVLHSGRELVDDNMNASYNILLSVMYLLYWAFEHIKLRNWILSAAGILLVFIYGTRGPILVILVFIAYKVLFFIKNLKSNVVKGLIILLISLLLLFVFSGDNLLKAAEFLSQKFKDMGFSTRVFDFFIEGEITTSLGRDRIAEILWDAVGKQPVLGYGLMGDRMLTGSYAHKIYLELWCQFGVIFGTLILCSFIFIPLRVIFRNKNTEQRNFLVMLFCTVFVKLLLSSSYLLEGNLFLLLGISIAASRRNNFFISKI